MDLTNEGRKTIAHGNNVGPEPRRATIAIRKRVNSHPLGMGPGTEVDNSH
jgi:hypothetical protein